MYPSYNTKKHLLLLPAAGMVEGAHGLAPISHEQAAQGGGGGGSTAGGPEQF